MAAHFKHVRVCIRYLNQTSRLSSRCLHQHVFTKQCLRTTGFQNRQFLVSRVQNAAVICSVGPIRHESSAPKEGLDLAPPTDYIPEPPPLPEIPEIVQTLNALGEPTLQSVGLGNYWPSGLLQQALEFLHVNMDLPWWGAIIAATITLRILMFPLVIKSQRNAANMANHMPIITRMQERFSQARMSGDHIEAARTGTELMTYMQKNDVKVMRNFLVPLAQLPVFLSVFVGVRQMANLPVESMKTGGLFWFTDLTIPDPFYALPLMTMSTFLLTIEIGADGVKAGTMGHTMKWAMRIMPVIMLPMISNFPAAMLVYWLTSNTFSLIQVMFLKIPKIRAYFKIPVLVKHDQSAQPKKKGFIKGFQQAWGNAKLAGQMEDRQRVDALRFRQAGQGPIKKTYSYDPTKVQTIKPLDVKPAMKAKGKS
ncbi:mitochondrial inner membrane protein OXA1L-like [Gigantopelta aegis]|uniref:mitochondrial inner membrane protein OXA1L-like n=1 Tax=Gigantopelta aegis TaxID=1735272 RepID=UPI001B88C51F|nr:mitochondrial inner membrane protein OXA1L-like [Gigantopelta aegis]